MDLTTWRVFDAGAPAPVSEHTSATDAELAARKHADDHGADRVVVHDRYHRTHDAPASPVGPGARALRTRARQLDAAREQTRRLARAGYSG
ncbi:MAG TPA: hypothetical protein VFY45_19285 [Baekduia sp.]|nr:hypothetical protein [Baekduia sp.]